MRWDKIRKLWEHINRQHTDQSSLSRERGQSLVEFAIILPMLLLLVLGTIDIGMGFKTYIALTNAAREGARWVSVNPSDPAGAQGRVEQEAELHGNVSAGAYTVTFSPDKSHYSAGEKVTVSINYEHELLFGALTGLSNVPFQASATMAVLY